MNCSWRHGNMPLHAAFGWAGASCKPWLKLPSDQQKLVLHINRNVLKHFMARACKFGIKTTLNLKPVRRLTSREWDSNEDNCPDDPEPIMVDEADEDDVLAAVLESEIGLGESDWNEDTRRR